MNNDEKLDTIIEMLGRIDSKLAIICDNTTQINETEIVATKTIISKLHSIKNNTDKHSG